ncbi:hypothetical protein QR78_10975 [Methylobacterium indicum]|nr:hypothetical protein QR78_10975 [Methylobacterium indicum]
MAPGATIRKLPAALSALPAPTEVMFPGFFAWSPVPTSAVVAALNLDRGLFATWRCRGIGPAELPPAWFRRVSGRPRYYRADTILTWLAARRGEEFDTPTAWRLGLLRDFEQDVSDPAAARKLVRLYAQAAGPAGGVSFTPFGWNAYLDGLLGK